ncbi:hypothetical protein A6R68_08986 [Neotoma lepida]|uniref:RNA transcription, translation and transport factor protein n=1 Tax=Neotoma lepida TaxID=56216 RepID=A0A1A6G254_NEOLE|nr:hypothetical protein A6R68_08986 [Neotoma lepida]
MLWHKIMALDYRNLTGFNCKDETAKNLYCLAQRPENQTPQDQRQSWLLGLAVGLEYGDNAEKHKDLVQGNRKNTNNAARNAEPLIKLDTNNPDFKAGVMALVNLLQIQRHDDCLVVLKAIRILVQKCLTENAVAKANQTREGLPVALDKHILGFDTRDAVLNEELRGLQMKINEAVVAIQAIIANPKTDHRLGKLEDGHIRLQLLACLA